VLLIGSGHQRGLRLALGVGSAPRGGGRPPQQPEYHQRAEHRDDLDPELRDKPDEDQQHEPSTQTTAAATPVTHGFVLSAESQDVTPDRRRNGNPDSFALRSVRLNAILMPRRCFTSGG